MNKTRKTSVGKGLILHGSRGKKRSGGKERIFLKEEDQGSFRVH